MDRGEKRSVLAGSSSTTDEGEKRSVLAGRSTSTGTTSTITTTTTTAISPPPALTPATRLVMPGAVRVLGNVSRQDDGSIRPSPSVDPSDGGDDEGAVADGSCEDRYVVGEVVDKDELRRQALQDTVVAHAEIWNSQTSLGNDDEQNTEWPKRKWIRGACGLVLLLVVVVVVVVVTTVAVSSGDGDDGADTPSIVHEDDRSFTGTTGETPTFSPTIRVPVPASPTAIPTLAPTRRPWESVQMFTGRFPDSETPTTAQGEGGGFGYDVAVAVSPAYTSSLLSSETPSLAPVYMNPEEDTLTVVATFESSQIFFFRRRRLIRNGSDRPIATPPEHTRELGATFHNRNYATFDCDSQGQCGSGIPMEVPLSQNLSDGVFAWKIALSRDGSRMVVAADGQLWYVGIPLVDSLGINEVATNANADFVVGLGSSLVLYDLYESEVLRYLRSGTTSAAALAVSGRRVAFGDAGDGIEVLDDYGIHVGGSPIQQQGSVVGSGSLSLAADGTILAVGTTFQDVGQVQVWRWSKDDNVWNPMGPAIMKGSQGDQFGASVVLSADDGMVLAVGAPDDSTNGLESGRVSVFRWSEDMQEWSQLGGDIFGLSGSAFGRSLALTPNGAHVVVGAPQSSRIGPRTGEVQLFSLGTA